MKTYAVGAALVLAVLLAARVLINDLGCGKYGGMIYVPSGYFIFGSNDPDPSRGRIKVYHKGFYIDRHEVTNGEYLVFIAGTSYKFPYVEEEWADTFNWQGGKYPEGKKDHPVVLISWHDASSYAAWAGKSLPTEKQWEKAARGPYGRLYAWGDDLAFNTCNHGSEGDPFYSDEDGYRYTSPAGTYPASGSYYGVQDMTGNAWEWCRGWYAPDYIAVKDGNENKRGVFKVQKGGSYFTGLRQMRCVDRTGTFPEMRRKTSGFRCVVNRRNYTRDAAFFLKSLLNRGR